jgi:hypothetical protein
MEKDKKRPSFAVSQQFERRVMRAPTKHQSIKINPWRRNFKEILWARGKQTSCQFMSRGGVKTSRELSLPACLSFHAARSSSFI